MSEKLVQCVGLNKWIVPHHGFGVHHQHPTRNQRGFQWGVHEPPQAYGQKNTDVTAFEEHVDPPCLDRKHSQKDGRWSIGKRGGRFITP